MHAWSRLFAVKKTAMAPSHAAPMRQSIAPTLTSTNSPHLFFKRPALAAAQALAPGGRLVNLGDSAGALLSLPSALLRGRSIDVLGFSILSLGWPGQSALMHEAFNMVRAGTLSIDVESVPLDDAEKAWDRLSAGRVGTRLVLVP